MAQQEVEVLQYWIRNDQGKVWGPLTFAAIDMFVANDVIKGRVQASADGENFADPGRFVDVRDAFPPELWGSTEPLPAAFLRPSASAPVVRPSAGRPAGPPMMSRGGGAPAAPAGRPGVAPVTPAARPGPATPAPTGAPAAAATAAAPTAHPEEAIPSSGLIGKLSAFRLYYLLAASNAGGKLSVELGGVTYNLLLKKGVPQQIRSSAQADSVVSYLVDNKMLPASAVSEVELGAAQYGGDPIAAGFALGLVKNPGAVIGALSAHGQGLLTRVLLAKQGSFHYDPSVAPPAGVMALGEKWKLLSQASRNLPGDEARARLGERMDFPVMKSGERVTLPELALNAQEARVAAMFEGVRSPAQLSETVGDTDLTARVCYLLGEVGLASFAAVKVSNSVGAGPTPEPQTLEAPFPKDLDLDLEQEAATPLPEIEPGPEAIAPPPAAPPRPAAPVAPTRPATPAAAGPPKLARPTGSSPAVGEGPPRLVPSAPKMGAAPPKLTPSIPKAPAAAPARPAVAPAKPVAIAAPKPAPAAKPPPPTDPISLGALLAKQANQNHFEVLGIPQSSTTAQIKVAFLQAVKAYHPDSTTTDAAPEVRSLKEEIFARINEANNVLSDEATRATYVDNLAHGGDEQVDVQAIFKAEEIFTRACIVVKARKFPEALKMFDEALALNDGEAEFHAWRAWAAFMCATDRKGALAPSIAAEQNALKLNAKCAPAAFFGGQMYKLVGDTATAMKWFLKAVELDPNHLEAKSEVRALGGKV